jgi:hypothetical protein
MKQYGCFFSRAVGDVAEFIVINAQNDAAAGSQADDILHAHPNYNSVAVFEADRRLADIKRVIAAE